MTTTAEMKPYFTMRREHARYHYEQIIQGIRQYEAGTDQESREAAESRCSREWMAMLHALWEAMEMASEWAYQTNHLAFRSYMKEKREANRESFDYLKSVIETSSRMNILAFPDMVVRECSRKRSVYPQRPLLLAVQEIYTFMNTQMDEMLAFIEGHQDESADWRNLDVGRSHFLCAVCNHPVTGFLRHLGQLKETKLRAREEYLPRRRYLYGYEAIRADLLPISDIQDEELLIHPEDVRDLQKKGGTGCCGPDASRFNLYCTNGHPIGREGTDCWMPQFVRIPLQNVRREPIE